MSVEGSTTGWTRREALGAMGAALCGTMMGDIAMAQTEQSGTARPHQVAVYYFPNYHVDPRNEARHGPGWTEWELVKRAEPRFPGHRQPRVPVWGYEDESDPRAMARRIDAAADHGIDAFIFDWYWYDDGPFLERGLERGFLGAANNDRLKFGLMWANHTWNDIHPAKLSGNPFGDAPLQFKGRVTRETFDTVVDHVIERYFAHPSYWRLEGRPYFSVYELMTLMEGLGGAEATRDALEHFRAKTREAGFAGLHLNAVLFGVHVLTGERAVNDPQEMLKYLGFDSITSYVWVHHVGLDRFPETDYREVMKKAQAHWDETVKAFPLPYHPNVTVGWDSSPRTVQSDRYINAGYPFMPVMSGNTPDAFREALAAAKAFLETRPPAERVLTINAWNEWTEGSYLEPDEESGMGYLEAIKAVFG
jgi:hypothetical protein